METMVDTAEPLYRTILEAPLPRPLALSLGHLRCRRHRAGLRAGNSTGDIMDKMCGKHMECVEYTYIYIYINNRKKLNGIYVTFVVSVPSFMVVGPRKLDMKPNQPQCHQLPPATAGHCAAGSRVFEKASLSAGHCWAGRC